MSNGALESFPSFLYICINMMCDRFKKSPTATLHNYWTFTSHMFIYLFPSPSLDLSTFGAWLFLARSLYAFQMYNEPNERSFTTDFMHARLLFFLLFVCVDFVVVVVIAEFHYYFFQLFFFRPINEQTDQSTSQPVRQSLNNKDFMSGILYTHTHTHSESSTAVNGSACGPNHCEFQF